MPFCTIYLTDSLNYPKLDLLTMLTQHFLYESHRAFILPEYHLTGVGVGVGDVRPIHQQEMTPAEHNYRRCGPPTEPVGRGRTVTVMCPPGGVTGRYLIVQTLGREDILTLCEVEAGNAWLKTLKTEQIAHILKTTFQYFCIEIVVFWF